MDSNLLEMDDATRLSQRSRRRKRLALLASMVLLPILLPTSYIASIGVMVWGQSSGTLSDRTMSVIPEWYIAPYAIYMNNAGPGSWHILKFLVWCDWMGGQDKTWEAAWEIHREDYEQLLRKAEGG